jgi:hypothetical protein
MRLPLKTVMTRGHQPASREKLIHPLRTPGRKSNQSLSVFSCPQLGRCGHFFVRQAWREAPAWRFEMRPYVLSGHMPDLGKRIFGD